MYPIAVRTIFLHLYYLLVLYARFFKITSAQYYVFDNLYFNLYDKVTGMRVLVVLVLTTYSSSYFFVLLIHSNKCPIFTSERVSLTVVVPVSIS